MDDWKKIARPHDGTPRSAHVFSSPRGPGGLALQVAASWSFPTKCFLAGRGVPAWRVIPWGGAGESPTLQVPIKNGKVRKSPVFSIIS